MCNPKILTSVVKINGFGLELAPLNGEWTKNYKRIMWLRIMIFNISIDRKDYCTDNVYYSTIRSS